MLYIAHLLPIHKLPADIQVFTNHKQSFFQCRKVRGEWDAIAALQAGPEKLSTLTPPNKDTVDGQNPAPPRMVIIPLFIGF